MGEEEDISGSVLLVVSEGDHDPGARRLSREVDRRGMGSEEWERIVAEAAKLDEIRIRVERERLLEHSSYFMSLASFSESNRESLNVDWNLQIFCILLQCVHGFHSSLSSSMVAPLIQAAVYFGMDEVITKCKNWVDSEMCNIRRGAEDGFLNDLLSIWSTATEHGEKSIGELCVKSLAINFAQAMVRESFVTLPLPLLEASVDHPELTIKSEADLCDALILWYENQEHGLPNKATVGDPIYLFKKIQLNLLPINFTLRRLLGKYPLSTFYTSSATSSESDDELLNSIIDQSGELVSKCVKDYLDFKPVIRLTEHLKELDLSCCQQITCHHLIAAAAQVAPVPKSSTRKALLTSDLGEWPGFTEFINMETLDISHCWLLDHKRLVLWLKRVCPNLLELRAQHCGHSCKIVRELGASLLNLLALDLSEPEELVDIVGGVTRTKVTCYRLQTTRDSGNGYIEWDPMNEYSTNRLRELSLRGRSEIRDDILLRIAGNCPSLQAVDISGCSELRDVGIAAFLNVYDRSGLGKLSAAGTRFGLVSCKTLISQADSSNELHHVLESLDLGRCSGLSSKDLGCLLQALPSLVSLGLAFSNLEDMALSTFFGISLRHLNLRETKVSGGVLSRILARNPNMKDLNVRGCTQLAVHPFDFSVVRKSSQWENMEAGWGLSDSAFSSFGLSSWKLQNLAVGVGGTISGHSLLSISENCPELRRLSLCFQVIPDEDLLRAIRKLKSLHTLELQNMSLNLGNLLREVACSLPKLRKLKLERVVPGLSDNDLHVFSESCTSLQSLSLSGCQRLTDASLSTIGHAWRGLQDLRLEDCQHIFTQNNVWSLLRPFRTLEVLQLRHIGKVLPGNFIMEVTRRLPFLARLLIDMCDSVDDMFSCPERKKIQRKETSRLKSVYINRCKRVMDLFQIASGVNATSSYYKGRTHKDTIVLEWNLVRLKESVVTERLTFD